MISYLSNHQKLWKLRKSSNWIEELILPRIKIRTSNQLQGIIRGEQCLGTFILLVRLADNFRRVSVDLRISGESTVAHVSFNVIPLAAVVLRILRLRATIRSQTITVAYPNEIVRYRMEPKILCAKRVHRGRHFPNIPGASSISSVEELVIKYARSSEYLWW